MSDWPACACMNPQYQGRPRWPELRLHAERQDTECDGWKRLLDLVERAADDGRETFSPRAELGRELSMQIVTLPATISKLKAVRSLDLYGSNLVRLPPEVGDMAALRSFDPYTSYRLHWFPYEITRCRRLRDSRVSTRALYGNFKYRPPFPRLPHDLPQIVPARCSVCAGPFAPAGSQQFWVSLRVATDVLPLLVHACSDECVARLPAPPRGYVPGPHRGGRGVKQPPQDVFYALDESGDEEPEGDEEESTK